MTDNTRVGSSVTMAVTTTKPLMNIIVETSTITNIPSSLILPLQQTITPPSTSPTTTMIIENNDSEIVDATLSTGKTNNTPPKTNEKNDEEHEQDEKCDFDPENSRKSYDLTTISSDTDDISPIQFDNPSQLMSSIEIPSSNNTIADKTKTKTNTKILTKMTPIRPLIIQNGDNNNDDNDDIRKSDKINCDNQKSADQKHQIKEIIDCVDGNDVIITKKPTTITTEISAAVTDATVAITPDTSKSALAFTIDFNEGKPVDSKKHNDILERFQKRHRRGVSLSKLDERPIQSPAQLMVSSTNSSAIFTKTVKPQIKRSISKQQQQQQQQQQQHQQQHQQMAPMDNSPQLSIVSQLSDDKIQLRDKTRLTYHSNDGVIGKCRSGRSGGGGDVDHRRSWSPQRMKKSLSAKLIEKLMPTDSDIVNKNQNHLIQDNDGENNVIPCLAPPLEFRKIINNDIDDQLSNKSSVSEAGTYTLDGDKYTEEQKALMSIDKLSKLTKELGVTITSSSCVPQLTTSQSLQLSNIATTDHLVNVVTAATVAELSTSPTKKTINKTIDDFMAVSSVDKLQQNKIKKHSSYLDKIKSKVKNITFHKSKSPETGSSSTATLMNSTQTIPTSQKSLDLGNFTSITASGVFNKNNKPLSVRKSSLTKSQIDSSEYIQKIDEKLLNSFTDSEKAEHNDYQLNIFSNNTKNDSDTTNNTNPNSININTNTKNTNFEITKQNPESYGIEQAETKNDWIQEWAKNARRNSKKEAAALIKPQQSISKSCRNSCERTFSTNNDEYQHEFNYHIQNTNNPYRQRRNSNNTRQHMLEEEFGDNLDRNYLHQQQQQQQQQQQHRNIHRYDDMMIRSIGGGSGSGGSGGASSSAAMYDVELLQRYALRHSTLNGRGDCDDFDSGENYEYNNHDDCDENDIDVDDDNTNEHFENESMSERLKKEFFVDNVMLTARPPMSPTKIPSPMHSMNRQRSMNRSLNSSVTDLDKHDTEMYLHKTAVAISTLQNIHHRNNSPKQYPSSPVRKPPMLTSSPSIRRYNNSGTNSENNKTRNSPGHFTSQHKRNLSSFDGYSNNINNNNNNNNSGRCWDVDKSQITPTMFHSYDSDNLNEILNGKYHSRHNSYEDKSPTNDVGGGRGAIGSMTLKISGKRSGSIDQTFAPHILSIKQQQQQQQISTPSHPNQKSTSNNQVKRSSSFSTKLFGRPSSASCISGGGGNGGGNGRVSGIGTSSSSIRSTLTPKLTPKLTKPTLLKSASSASFKNISNNNSNSHNITNNSKTYDDGYYLNDNDNLYGNNSQRIRNEYSSESDFSDIDGGTDGGNVGNDDGTTSEKELISNTRYNKAFLKRLEQNKQKVIGSSSVGIGTAATGTTNATGATATNPKYNQGVSACPNTPELPRRSGDGRTRQSMRDRASMPRDSSINRMKQDIASLSMTKKSLNTTQINSRDSNRNNCSNNSSSSTNSNTGGGSNKILPKYLDISKYKPTQGNTFLKRDESKSTLINKEIKRSTSAFGVSGGGGGGGGVNGGLNKSDIGRSSIRSIKSAAPGQSKSVLAANSNAAAGREAELAMWRRRASYDPMKAAAEGKRKQEEAKKVSQQISNKCNNESKSVVLRSQSFHSGVGSASRQHSNQFSSSDSMDAIKNRWSLISTESSDDEFLE